MQSKIVLIAKKAAQALSGPTVHWVKFRCPRLPRGLIQKGCVPCSSSHRQSIWSLTWQSYTMKNLLCLAQVAANCFLRVTEQWIVNVKKWSKLMGLWSVKKNLNSKTTLHSVVFVEQERHNDDIPLNTKSALLVQSMCLKAFMNTTFIHHSTLSCTKRTNIC